VHTPVQDGDEQWRNNHVREIMARADFPPRLGPCMSKPELNGESQGMGQDIMGRCIAGAHAKGRHRTGQGESWGGALRVHTLRGGTEQGRESHGAVHCGCTHKGAEWNCRKPWAL